MGDDGCLSNSGRLCCSSLLCRCSLLSCVV